MMNWRRWILISLWSGALWTALLVTSGMLWGLLFLLGDITGVPVARILTALSALLFFINLVVLVIGLAGAYLQLTSEEEQE